MTEDQFFEVYRPVKNHLDDNASFDGYLFETYGEELDCVRQHPDSRIWTVLDCDGQWYIGSGYHHVNRVGYLISGVEYTGPPLDIKCEF